MGTASQDNLTLREDALTVIKGCLDTLALHWDQLTEAQRRELVEAAHRRTEILVAVLDSHSVSRASA